MDDRDPHYLRVVADQPQALSKGAPIKVAIARRLLSETTMPLKWIGETLSMGASTFLLRQP